MTRQVSRADSPLEGFIEASRCAAPLTGEDAAVKGTYHNDTQGAAEPGYRSSASVAREVELIARIADGDRRAFEELYNLYHGRLARFLTRLTKRYDIAEEVINDTLLDRVAQSPGFSGRLAAVHVDSRHCLPKSENGISFRISRRHRGEPGGISAPNHE